MITEKKEQILTTIDQLGVTSIKQLHKIINRGSYRYTCKLIQQLDTYLHVYRSKQKLVYLNKEGRQLIGSEKEVKKSVLFDHMLLSNEAYIHFNCPVDWRREYPIETLQEPRRMLDIKIMGLNVVNKKKVIPDAVFSRNGYVYLIEIDNTRSMQDNRKKVDKYREMWQDIKKHFNAQPKLCIFTVSEKRKKDFIKLCEKLPSEVFCFNEL